MRARRAPRRPGWLRALGWLAILLVSLLLVTWRQTLGIARERELRELEAERSVAETERVELARRVVELRSRARVVRVARERLRMHLPTEREIVFLPVEAGAERADADAEAR